MQLTLIGACGLLLPNTCIRVAFADVTSNYSSCAVSNKRALEAGLGAVLQTIRELAENNVGAGS